VKNQNVKLNAQIKDVKCLTAPNASQSANNPTVLHIVKHQNQNANQFAKNQNVIGNVKNLPAPNQNVNWSAKIQIVLQKLSAVPALWELLLLLLLSPYLRKPNKINNVVNANKTMYEDK
jgi:hypothetical protein